MKPILPNFHFSTTGILKHSMHGTFAASHNMLLSIIQLIIPYKTYMLLSIIQSIIPYRTQLLNQTNWKIHFHENCIKTTEKNWQTIKNVGKHFDTIC